MCEHVPGQLMKPSVLAMWPPAPLTVMVSELSCARPTPLSMMVCGLPETLSLILMNPIRVPPAVGVKVTLAVQLPPGCKDEGQLLVCEKSAPLGPLMPIDEIATAALPVFSSRTGNGLLELPTVSGAKLSDGGLKDK